MKTKKGSIDSEFKEETPVKPVVPVPFEPSSQFGHIEKPEMPEPLTDEYVNELLTSDKTSWNIVIPKKNIFIIIILALICWGLVGLISLFFYQI